jgi:hypothetical protein
MKRSAVWPIVVGIVILYIVAGVLVPCDGDCSAEQEIQSYVW